MAQPVYLSEEEVARALAAFSAHDPERRGIRPCDLGPVFRAMGEAVTETEVFDMMCDANVTSEAANTLPFDEVLRLLKERRQRLAAGVSPADLAMVRSVFQGG
jgi:Ca2+-binding EF-hand superfamily protein